MNEVIITGANGLIGSACCTILDSQYSFTKFDVSDPQNPVDITNADAVNKAIQQSSAQFVVHFAAYTDVTGAWQQSGDKSGPAYRVNVNGTENLVNSCNEFNKHLIHVSTSYVFDGEKKTAYVESDPVNPIEWYGETKALAEQYIQENASNWTILRIDQPFRNDSFSKLDLVHKIAQDLQAGTLLPQFEDHYFGPTWIPDFVKVIEWSIKNKISGLYHASSGETWTNYQFAQEIASIINSSHQVVPSKLADYLKSNNRPYQKNTALNCEKLKSEIDFELTPISQALKQVAY